MLTLDATDHRILVEIQRDASLGVEQLGERVGLSRNACWRRVKALEASGVIRKRVALLDASKLGLGLTVFIMIRTSSHDAAWLAKFAKAMREMPEILGAHRMTGDLDYLIRARVSDVAGYDRLYQTLIERVEMSDVSASFVMEDLKDTTELPI